MKTRLLSLAALGLAACAQPHAPDVAPRAPVAPDAAPLDALRDAGLAPDALAPQDAAPPAEDGAQADAAPAPPATLRGFVHKGPAAHVRVRAYTLDGAVLAETVSDARGGFRLRLTLPDGPIRLEAAATDDPTTPSAFEDEIRGPTPWPADRALEALVPQPTAGMAPLVISPLSHLALAAAVHDAGAGVALAQAYPVRLADVAALLGLDALPAALPHLRPAPFDSLAESADAATRLSLALGCLSARAAAMAPADAPDAWSALDLVALYAQDLRADGHLDGLAAGAPARLPAGPSGSVALEPDPVRTGLALACMDWLHHPRNQQGLAEGDATGWIRGLRERGDSPLLDPDQAPALDPDGPHVSVVATVGPAAAGAVFQPELAAEQAVEPVEVSLTAVRGSVVFQVRAADPAGVWQVTARLEDPLPPDVAQATRALDGVDLAVETDALTQGRHVVVVEAVDRLGQRREARFPFTVDRTPPRLSVRLDGLIESELGWHTAGRRPGTVRVEVEAEQPVQISARFLGQALLDEPAEPGAQRISLPLPVDALAEGEHRLEVETEDALGQRSTAQLAVWVDRTPPEVEVGAARCTDEALLPADGDPQGVPSLPIGAEGGTVRLWQTTWALQDRAERCRLPLNVDDGTRPGLQIGARACLVDPDAPQPEACLPNTERAWDLSGQRSPGVPLHTADGGLPFDPFDPDQTEHALRITALWAEDLVGHRTAIHPDALPTLTLQVVPPSLAVRFVGPDPGLDHRAPTADLRALGYDDGGLAALFEPAGAPLRLHVLTVEIDNPHPVEVHAAVALDDWRWRLETTLHRALFEPARSQLAMHAPPACADQADRFVPIEACAPAPNGLRCSHCAPAGGLAAVRALGEVYGDTGGEARVAPGGDGRWILRVPPGGRQVLDLSVLADLGAPLSPAHRGSAPPDGLPFHHAQVLAPVAFEHRSDPGDSGWFIGRLYEVLTEVRLVPSPHGMLRVFSALGEVRSGPTAAVRPGALVHPNPSLE